MRKKRYVLGFLFDSWKKKVLLIRKGCPEWQAGKLNGLGGKIEEGESPEEAMIREFREEAGFEHTGWQQYLRLEGPDFEVFVFRGQVFSFYNYAAHVVADEEVQVYTIGETFYHKSVSNLHWMLALALDNEPAFAEVRYA